MKPTPEKRKASDTPKFNGARAREAHRRATHKTCRKIDADRLEDRKKRQETGGIVDGIYNPL